MMHTLRHFAWIICGIYATVPAYWMMVHPFAEKWRAVRYKFALLAPLWCGMWCVAWGASYPWRNALLYASPWTWAAALPLWAVSIFMYVNGGSELSFLRVIGWHELKPEPQSTALVTHGIHRLVRHPLYLGHICTMLGFSVGSGIVACYGLFAFTLVTGAIMIVFEERELHARFGPAWEEYCQRTPAIFPLRWE